MPAARRKHIIDHLDSSRPFYTRAEFIECLAALTSAHSEEMQRRVTGSNKPLYRLLWCAAAVSRVEWLFNTIRMRARLTPQEASLLSSGTTSNEALHAELNRHFRQTQQVHQATLRLKLRILQHAKLLAHNSAMQRPTTRQMSQASVLARLAARRVWNAKQWRSWCKVLRGEVRARKAHLPLGRRPLPPGGNSASLGYEAACEVHTARPRQTHGLHAGTDGGVAPTGCQATTLYKRRSRAGPTAGRGCPRMPLIVEVDLDAVAGHT